MRQRIFSFVGAAAMTSMVGMLAAAGCSSTERARFSASGAAGDAGVVPADPGGEGDAAPRRSTRDASVDDSSSCVAKEPIDATKVPYKKAGLTPGACTPDEASAISAYFKQHANDEDFTVSAWENEVGPACARCVFSDGSGPTWTPIIVKDDQVDTIDRGGCVEALSGNEACGRAYQQVNECSITACLPKSEGGQGSCKGQKPFYECLDDRDALFDVACKDAYDAVTNECGDSLADYEKACDGRYTFEGPIDAMCVKGGAGGG